MSQSQLAGLESRSYERASDEPTVVDTEEAVGEVLHLLDDPDCRAILEATSDESLSASEISDACDVPRSTVYRKLDRLSEAGLLEEGLRVRFDGKHTQEYSRRVDDVVVSVSDEGSIELEISRTSESGFCALAD